VAKKKAIKKPVRKPAKKAPVKKTAVKKAAAKKPIAKKMAVKKPVVKKAVAPKASPQKLSLPKLIPIEIQPLDDRLLVEVLANETRTAGGLYIPDSALEQNAPLKGKVLMVGRGRKNKKGQIRPMDVSKGDTVLFARYTGSSLKIDSREVCILRESEILGIVER
jgi:chaperonin GroES